MPMTDIGKDNSCRYLCRAYYSSYYNCNADTYLYYSLHFPRRMGLHSSRIV